MNYNKRLIDLIEGSDLPKGEIYKRLGIAQAGYWQITSGTRSFTVSQLIAGAKLFNVSLDYLCGLKTPDNNLLIKDIETVLRKYKKL